MASVVEKNILRLQVAVDDVKPVQTFKSTQELSSVKPGTVDVESLLFLQMVKEFATIDESQYQIEFLWRLE